MIRPFGPVPLNEARSTPSSCGDPAHDRGRLNAELCVDRNTSSLRRRRCRRGGRCGRRRARRRRRRSRRARCRRGRPRPRRRGSGTRCPAAGDGISTVVLSVWISTSGSSSAISWPSVTSQRAISPSVRPSPRSGSLNSYATAAEPTGVSPDPGVGRDDQDAQAAVDAPERDRLLVAGELRRDRRRHVADLERPLGVPDRDRVRVVLVRRLGHEREPLARIERRDRGAPPAGRRRRRPQRPGCARPPSARARRWRRRAAGSRARPGSSQSRSRSLICGILTGRVPSRLLWRDDGRRTSGGWPTTRVLFRRGQRARSGAGGATHGDRRPPSTRYFCECSRPDCIGTRPARHERRVRADPRGRRAIHPRRRPPDRRDRGRRRCGWTNRWSSRSRASPAIAPKTLDPRADA